MVFLYSVFLAVPQQQNDGVKLNHEVMLRNKIPSL